MTTLEAQVLVIVGALLFVVFGLLLAPAFIEHVLWRRRTRKRIGWYT